MPSEQDPLCTSPNEVSDPMANHPPLTGCEPNIFVEWRPLTFSSRSNPATRCPCTCMTRSSATRPSAERSLQHCSFRSEKIQSLLSSQSLSAGHVRTGRLVEFSSRSSCSREKPSRDSENEQIRILLERQKEQFSLIVEQRFTNTSSKPIMTEEIFKN